MVDVPALIDLTEWSSPQIRLRRWAGEYGAKNGLTKPIGPDDEGRPRFADTPEHDAFRHAFVAAAKYLSGHKGIMDDPFGRLPERADEIAASTTIRLGFLNEWYGSNPLEQHLQDYWNNYEGVLLGREALNELGPDVSNDDLAAYVAGKIKNSPERFILDKQNDPRVKDIKLYETERLPRGSFGDFFVPDPLIEAFPELYGDQ